jgi:hypothetical protein
MFSPIVLAGKFVTQLKGIDNDKINEDVLARKSMKLDDTPGNTFQEDSYYPETEACNKLIEEVDKVIQKNVNSYFNTYNKWAHILEPNESTMIHTHDSPGAPPHISWVYYSKTEPNCGNIVWQTTIHNKMVTMEENPSVGTLILFPNWVPHFTKKNISNDIRISISGNAKPDQKDYENVGKDPQQIFNLVGLVT